MLNEEQDERFHHNTHFMENTKIVRVSKCFSTTFGILNNIFVPHHK